MGSSGGAVAGARPPASFYSNEPTPFSYRYTETGALFASDHAPDGTQAYDYTCAMLIPKTAHGKRLRGTIKVTFRNVSVTKSFSYRVP